MKIGGDRRSSNVEDRRSEGGGGYGVSGGAGNAAIVGILMRLLFSKAGRRFILPVVVIAVLGFVFFPKQMQGLISSLSGQPQVTQSSTPVQPSAQSNQSAQFASAVLETTEEVWGNIFKASGSQYKDPGMVLYTGGTRGGCGTAQSAMGPFYCPLDQKVYLDVNFFNEMAKQMQAPGDFAQAYVIAHEVGHHVQNLIGILSRVQREKQGASKAQQNALQVRVELQADCFAGVWANHVKSLPGVTMDPGDFAEAIQAAHAVGDDTLQRKARGYVVPESFTHGSAAQRQSWFKKGYTTGSVDSCNTFAAKSL